MSNNEIIMLFIGLIWGAPFGCLMFAILTDINDDDDDIEVAVRLVVSVDSKTFSDEINDLISEDWVRNGSITVLSNNGVLVYIQEMINYNNND